MRGGNADALPCERPGSTVSIDSDRTIEQLTAIEAFFTSLMRHGNSKKGAPEGAEQGLGGQLLYVGELDETGRALATAGNVAGAASLSATADAAAQRLAVRESVVDFLVNSVDEALRILKNEIRKREPVAVCVAASPEAVEREMLERGVQPNLLAETGGVLRGETLKRPETCIVLAEPVAEDQALLAWSVRGSPGMWMPKLDVLAMDCLAVEESEAMRWLRRVPRYLSRDARGSRVLRCTPRAGRDLVARMEEEMKPGRFDVAVWVSLCLGEERVEREWKSREAPDRGA